MILFHSKFVKSKSETVKKYIEVDEMIRKKMIGQ